MFQTESGTTVKSHVWRDTEIKGNIESKGSILIDGKHVGDIKCTSLEVGEQAEIEGNIQATEMVVSGKVKGNVKAVNLTINASAHVEGTLTYKTLGMAEGAMLMGDLKRDESPLG